MTSRLKNKYTACFGIIDSVFPTGSDGRRNTPGACLVCLHKTECLKSAMEEPGGLKVRQELIDRAYESGMIGFLERWSKRKDLGRKIREQVKGRALNRKS